MPPRRSSPVSRRRSFGVDIVFQIRQFAFVGIGGCRERTVLLCVASFSGGAASRLGLQRSPLPRRTGQSDDITASAAAALNSAATIALADNGVSNLALDCRGRRRCRTFFSTVLTFSGIALNAQQLSHWALRRSGAMPRSDSSRQAKLRSAPRQHSLLAKSSMLPAASSRFPHTTPDNRARIGLQIKELKGR